MLAIIYFVYFVKVTEVLISKIYILFWDLEFFIIIFTFS